MEYPAHLWMTSKFFFRPNYLQDYSPSRTRVARKAFEQMIRRSKAIWSRGRIQPKGTINNFPFSRFFGKIIPFLLILYFNAFRREITESQPTRLNSFAPFGAKSKKDRRPLSYILAVNLFTTSTLFSFFSGSCAGPSERNSVAF